MSKTPKQRILEAIEALPDDVGWRRLWQTVEDLCGPSETSEEPKNDD